VNAIRDINGRLMSIEYRHMTPEEMKQAAHIKEAIESIERDNRDIDTVLADLGFVKYTREEVA
jgi:methylphosphotriester-DNA--protein-cysteine methyltransferase